MPRRRTSLQVLSDTGALAHDRKRYAGRVNARESNGDIGEPPDHYDDNHRAVWAEIVADCRPGVLTRADRKITEVTTDLMCRMRLDADRVQHTFSAMGTALIAHSMGEDDAQEFHEEMRKALTPSAGETRVLQGCLGLMGLTPTSRFRVTIKNPGRSDRQEPSDG